MEEIIISQNMEMVNPNLAPSPGGNKCSWVRKETINLSFSLFLLGCILDNYVIVCRTKVEINMPGHLILFGLWLTS